MEVIDYALDLLGIGKFKDYQTKNLSGGTKRKLSVACTLINDPDVFILDEPTVRYDQCDFRASSFFLVRLGSELKSSNEENL